MTTWTLILDATTSLFATLTGNTEIFHWRQHECWDSQIKKSKETTLMWMKMSWRGTLPVHSHLVITKFLHDCWLPTNHNLHKQNPTVLLCCGLCQAPDKTGDHICLCPHTSANLIRQKSLDNLATALSESATDPATSCRLLCLARSWAHYYQPLLAPRPTIPSLNS